MSRPPVSLAPLLAPAAVLLAALAAACGSPQPHPSYPAAPLPTPAAVNALADLPQDLAGPPGTRSFWDLDAGLALQDGGDDQFDRAVQLHVGIPTTPPTADSLPNELGPVTPFPFDQQWSELTFTTPMVARGQAQLSAVVASANALLGQEVVLSPSFTVPAAGGAAAPTRLSQAVDLTGVAAPLTLGWTHHGVVLDGLLPAPVPASWRVVVRDAASGNVLTVAFDGSAVTPGPVAPVDVSAAAGRKVTLDFELLGSPRGFVAVDEVALLDAGAVNHVANPGFEGASLAPWTVTGPDLPCQVVSGKRLVGGLEVERRVYARPDRRWARFADVFRNPGAAAITTQLNYLHELGASTEAVIQKSAGGKALSAWDAGPLKPARRDLAIVFGTSPLGPVYRSSTAAGLGDGSPTVWTRFPLTVPAGQVRVVVHFVVLSEDRTGDTATAATARAALADQEAAAIAAGFWSTTTWREGMTAEQVAAIVNF